MSRWSIFNIGEKFLPYQSTARRRQNHATYKIVIDARLPVPHKLAVVVVGEGCGEGIAFRPVVCMGLGDNGFRAACGGMELDRNFSGRDMRSNLEHLHEAVVGFVPGDIPDRIAWHGGGNENAIQFGNFGFAHHRNRIPAFDPIGFANRAQQWENGHRLDDLVLCVASGYAIWLVYVHGRGMYKDFFPQ